MTNFFQSPRWWQFQSELGERVVSREGPGWHFFGRVVEDRLGRYLYLPYGPVCDSQSAFAQAIETARLEAKQLGCYRLVAEPALPITIDQVRKLGRRMLKGFQPSRTLVIDLEQSEEQIIGAMNSTRRKQFRGATRRGFSFDECDSDEDFLLGLKMLRQTSESRSFEVKDDFYFDRFRTLVDEGVAKVFVAKHHGETKVVGYVIDDFDTRYYLYVGRDLSNNSLQISAPFIVFLILDAKRRGLRFFDFYGISARDDVNDEWTGFTVFKKTFGGRVVQYAGAWEFSVAPVRYLLRRLIDWVTSGVSRSSKG